MAKNLKLNIKNTQLASAFKVTKSEEAAEPKTKLSRLKEEAVKEQEAAPVKKKARIMKVSPGEKLPAAEDTIDSKEASFAEATEELLPSAHFEEKVESPAEEIEEIELAKPEIKPTKQADAVETKPQEAATPAHPVRQATSSSPTSYQPSTSAPAIIRKEPPKQLKPPKKKEEARFDSRDRQGLRDIDNEAWRKRRQHKPKRYEIEEIIIRPKVLSVRLPITIKDLAQEMKLKASQLIAKLFMKGVVLTLNDYLDDETTVQLLGHDFDCNITIDTAEEERLRITDQTIKQEIHQADPNLLALRPPVVTFMGHVDHGKTSLIDSIRKSNRVAGEAGAITQHIGAFKVHTAAGDVTVLDTPGHEAFYEMRSRGANVTDIVVLVVAGDEGIRAQTDEAIRQARDANVQILVAINKSDKPNFDVQKVYRELADRDLMPEAWGGTTITVNCSAATGAGVHELLEMIALQAEILELRANPKERARGTVLESEMHKGMGAVATVLVQNGTLRKNDAIVFGSEFGRIKTMQDDHGRAIDEAGPSTPVKITGLSSLAVAGSEFIVVKNEKEARELANARAEGAIRALSSAKMSSLDRMMAKKESGEMKILPVILRADVQGSLEALKNSLLKIHSKKVRLEIVDSDVGEISESDIELAAASKATVVGFHTRIESRADEIIKQKKIPVVFHDVIYHLVDEVKLRMKALLDKIEEEHNLGKAAVKAVFKSSQLGNIAGCQVLEGIIKRQALVRQIRGKEIIWKGKIGSLKRMKEDIKEVKEGFECGILLDGQSDFKEGDIFEAYEITYREQDL